MRLFSLIVMLLLILDTLADNFGLQLNGTNGITFIIHTASIVITPSLERKDIASVSAEKSLLSTILEYGFIIGVSAVLGHYLINKFKEDTKKETDGFAEAIVHSTFELDGVTYAVLKCNVENNEDDDDESDVYSQISYTESNSTAETVFEIRESAV